MGTGERGLVNWDWGSLEAGIDLDKLTGTTVVSQEKSHLFLLPETRTITPSLANSNFLQDPKEMGAFSKCPTLGIGDIWGNQARNKVSRNQSHVAPAFCALTSSLVISLPILFTPGIVGTQSRTPQALGKVHGGKTRIWMLEWGWQRKVTVRPSRNSKEFKRKTWPWFG